jgi:hypothetical protein
MTDHRANTHDWSIYDRREVCSCGAKRCIATRLNTYSRTVRCRTGAQKGSNYCKQHAYLGRSKAKQQSMPSAVI